MFTIKLYNGEGVWEFIHAARFQVREAGERVAVIIYPERGAPGTEFGVSDHPHDWAVCFVENSAGKTITRYGPAK